jgi:hypothetical protein
VFPKNCPSFAEESLNFRSFGDSQFLAKLPDALVDGVNFHDQRVPVGP